jgi:hypothetical protein
MDYEYAPLDSAWSQLTFHHRAYGGSCEVEGPNFAGTQATCHTHRMVFDSACVTVIIQHEGQEPRTYYYAPEHLSILVVMLGQTLPSTSIAAVYQHGDLVTFAGERSSALELVQR